MPVPEPQLVVPTSAVRPSFLAAVDELVAEGRATSGSMVGEWIARFGAGWEEPAGFERFVQYLLDDADPAFERPRDRVPQSTFWLVEGEEYLGRISVRHRLTDWLLQYGGHIGYEVRPSRRRQGHATTMLGAVLPHARDLGLDEALLTCDHDNVGSRKVIEARGGRFEDRRGVKLRYWVATGAGA